MVCTSVLFSSENKKNFIVGPIHQSYVRTEGCKPFIWANNTKEGTFEKQRKNDEHHEQWYRYMPSDEQKNGKEDKKRSADLVDPRDTKKQKINSF